MSEPRPTTTPPAMSQLAAALRPAFRCPTTPPALRELHGELLAALDGGTAIDPGEAALRVAIMLRNAIAAVESGYLRTVPADGTIEMDDCDPDIGLYLALYGVERVIDRMGWQHRSAA